MVSESAPYLSQCTNSVQSFPSQGRWTQIHTRTHGIKEKQGGGKAGESTRDKHTDDTKAHSLRARSDGQHDLLLLY